MIKEKEKMNGGWKQALERRQAGSLPSNFSYQMMERVRREAEKQQKRKTIIGWIVLLIAALAVLEMGIYYLLFYLDVRVINYFLMINLQQDCYLFQFYGGIALVALILLGLDYWLRRKYLWK